MPDKVDSSEPDREKWIPAFYINENGEFIIDDSVMRINQTEYADLTPISSNLLSLESVVEIAANFLGTSISELKNLSRARSLSQKRALVTFFALRYSLATITEIGCFFNRSATTMKKQCEKIKENLESVIDDDTYQRICDALEDARFL